MKKHYIKTFEGLRGYAILLIYISHCSLYINENGVNATTNLGGCGVSIFIMLSGYLLFHQYEDSELDLKRVLKKRLKKFYPLHIITLIIALPFSIPLLIDLDIKTWLALGANVLLVQSWIPDNAIYFSFNFVSWYLSITIFFIVISPLVLKMFKKLKNLVILLIPVIIMTQFLICYIFNDSIIAHWIIYICPIVRSLDFILGASVSYIKKVQLFSKNITRWILLFATIDMIFVGYCSLNRNSEWFSVFLWTIPVAVLLYGAASFDCKEKIISVIFNNKMIVYLGKISFNFFLIHQLCIRYIHIICVKTVGEINVLIEYTGIFIMAVILSVLWNEILNLFRRSNYE